MIVYLDMDGVLADFGRGIAEHYDIPVDEFEDFMDSNQDDVYADIRNTDWFFNLKPAPNAEYLVKEVQTMTGGEWGILSAPLRGDRDNSAYWKRRWLEKQGFLPDSYERIVFESNKEKYARRMFAYKQKQLVDTPNVLVDDKQKKVDRFTAKGGVGIHYVANTWEGNKRDVSIVLDRIQKYLDQYRTV